MSEETWEPDPVIPGFLQNAMNEADAGHFEEGEEPPAVVDTGTGFDGDISGDVRGLLNLGKLTQRIELFGHVFVLKTLTVGEELAIALMVNEYAGTIGQGKAFQTAVIAAALVSVDGRPLVAALGPDIQASLSDSFEYIINNWYMSTVDAIWDAYQDLLIRQAQAYQDVMGKSPASRKTS